ncbi:MAG TPA: hypothetical protein VLE99_02840 [Candidatus Saccharimonadales bacterium]|nr:hypothetical protein [Candidatus Saccharimonadales bacterium]
MTQTINAPVNVSAYYFAGKSMKTFPRAIEYGGQAVTFASGLRYLVQRGTQEAVKLFDMSTLDGLTYRLQQSGDTWTLLGTKGAW